MRTRAATLVFAAGIAAVAASRLGTVGALGPAIQIADFAFAAAALLALVAVARGDLRPRWIAPDAALALYALVAVASLAVTPSVRTTLVKLLGLGFLASLYVVGSHLAADPARRRILFGGWLAGAAVSAVAGLAGVILFYLGARTPAVNPFMASYGSIPVGSYPRIVAFFANPNMYCSYCSASLAVLATYWEEAPARQRPLLLSLAALLVVNAFFTLSVGLGGLALGAAIWWSLRGGRLRGLALAGGGFAAAGFAALTLVNLVPRGAGDIHLGVVDIQLAEGGRVDIWRGALHNWEQHPLTGMGYGMTVATTTNPRAYVNMENWDTKRMTSTQAVKLEAHEVWLNVLGQVGIPGLLLFVAFVLLVLAGKASGQDAIFCGLLAVFVYQGLFAAIEDARHIWLLFGFAVAPRRAPSPPQPGAISR